MTTLEALRSPFDVDVISWKPGPVKGGRALALAYADTRAYQDRLDDVFGLSWQVRYTPVDAKSVVCELTLQIDGAPVVRSATGQDTDLPSAEAQAFKRACSMFGLGRYLYRLGATWEQFDEQRRQFTPDALQRLQAKLGATQPTAQPTAPQHRPQRTGLPPAAVQRLQERRGPAEPQPRPQPATNDPDERTIDVWHEDWTTAADYPAAMAWARRSGKFGHERHFIAAWGKLFKENQAHLPENARKFLDSWYIYVSAHEPAAPAKVAA